LFLGHCACERKGSEERWSGRGPAPRK